MAFFATALGLMMDRVRSTAMSDSSNEVVEGAPAFNPESNRVAGAGDLR